MLTEIKVKFVLYVLNMGLNPCFNGICSLSSDEDAVPSDGDLVLILVLMEYAH